MLLVELCDHLYHSEVFSSSLPAIGRYDQPSAVSSRPSAGLRPLLAPFIAHVRDEATSSATEGSDICELFEDNFDQFRPDEERIGELNDAIGEGDLHDVDQGYALVHIPSPPRPLAQCQGSDATENWADRFASRAAPIGCYSGADGGILPTNHPAPSASVGELAGSPPSPKEIPSLQGGKLSTFLRGPILVSRRAHPEIKGLARIRGISRLRRLVLKSLDLSLKIKIVNLRGF